METQLIPSITGKQTDQWINHFWIDEMDSILVTPYGLLMDDRKQIDRINVIASQPFREIIIDNCAFSIHRGYMKASEIERLMAQIKLAQICNSDKITIVVPDFVQDFEKTMRSYRKLETILRGVNHDRVRLMYVLQGTPLEMRQCFNYLETLPYPLDIAIATQERSMNDLRAIKPMMVRAIENYRVHLFGETRDKTLKLLQGAFNSYDTSKHFWDNWHNGFRGFELFERVAHSVANTLNSNYKQLNVLEYLEDL